MKSDYEYIVLVLVFGPETGTLGKRETGREGGIATTPLLPAAV